MYSKSLFRFRWLSGPICTVAYVGVSAGVHGGKDSFEKTAKGGKSARATLLEVKAAALATTSRRSGWEGWTQ